MSNTAVLDKDRSLTAHDRCDKCGSQAWVRVLLLSGFELMFCSHHSAENIDALRGKYIHLHSELWKLQQQEQK
jgi:hypothetical protein